MKRVPFGLILLLSFCFIGFGDQVLPKSVGKYSTALRGGIDNTIVSAFPSWRPKDPNAATENTIRQIEKQ